MAAGELTTDRAKGLTNEMAELNPAWVIVEGGEPLLRSDLFTLLGLMKQKRLDTHLITNGMFLTLQILTALKRLQTKVMVSIDGASAATYESIRDGADFDTVIEHARAYAREGLLEAINFTILKSNYAEIPGIFELAASIGVHEVTFIGFKPCHGYREELLGPEEYDESIKLACQGAQKTGAGFFFDEPFFWATVKEAGLSAQMQPACAGILSPATTACIFGEYLFIDTNGDVKPCSFAPLVLGNVNDRSLVGIWQEVLASPFFQKMKDPKSRTGHCGRCQYLEDCKGCRSRTFMITGDWFSPDPCCPLSLKLGGGGGK
jgi:radical SAM protein with 4Fe4S-binding SPASM domain